MPAAKEDSLAKLGAWAFIIGIVIAVIAGIPGLNLPIAIVALILAILGIVVGLLNVTEKEATSFLVAAVALVLVATGLKPFGEIPTLGAVVLNIVNNIGVFMAPAALVVAIKAIWDMASTR